MKPLLTIWETQHFCPSVLDRLGERFALSNARPDCNLFQAEFLWCRLKVPKIELFPHLRLIACNCTDVSHLPLAECQRRGIEVLSLKGIEGLDTVHATAEHTISLMLQALRHQCDRTSGKIGRELSRKRVGIVGCGRVGQQVKKFLDWGFNCTVYPLEAKELKCRGWDRYDIVSIHASLNETSRGMVDAEFLSKLKPGCILVNTARHAIIDEMAVLEWLHRDANAVYAHDFKREWSTEFFGMDSLDQIISTPHIGGWTLESLHKTEELLAERVIEWARNHLEVTA